jgi:hypothetical protein
VKVVVAVGVLALALSGCSAAPQPRSSSPAPVGTPSSTPAHRPPTVAPASDRPVFDLRLARGQGRLLDAGQVARGSEVPWSRVGSGWRLALLDQGKQHADVFSISAQLLDLIAPSGGRYQLFKISTRGLDPWRLDDWSADGRSVLLSHGDGGQHSLATEIDLRTGAQRSLRLSHEYGALLRADGAGIWLTDAVSRVRSVSWDGEVTAYDAGPTLLQAPDGRILASGRGPITVLSLDGDRRTLGSSTKHCHATRFWKPGVVLADCSGRRGPRLAAVPLDGGRPSWISLPHGKNANDLGDYDAYLLDGTTYLQVAGACGYTFLGRQNDDGSITNVNPPDAIGNVTMQGVAGHSLLVTHETSCEPPGPPVQVLAAYDPVARTERVLTQLPEGERFERILAFGEPAAVGW